MKLTISESQRRTFESTRHIAVRANAGSGKTSVLTHRFIWLVANDGISIEKLVAITFTTKAAAEMRQRIHSTILLLLNDEEARLSVGFTSSDAVVVERLTVLRINLSRIQVTTFHAYCNGILRKFGHHIGIDPQSREIGTSESKQLLKDSIRSTLRDHFHRPIQEFDILSLYDSLDITNVEAILERLITDMENSGDALAWLDGLKPSQVVERRKSAIPELLRPLLFMYLSQLVDTVKIDDVKNSPEAIAAFKKISEYHHSLEQRNIDVNSVQLILNLLNQLYTKAGTPRKKSTILLDPTRLPDLKIGWKQLLAGIDFSNEESELEQATLVLTLRRLSLEAYHRFVAEKRLRKGIDYSDMISGVVHLLESHPEIRNELQRSLSHLMVDEFQDTDPRQLHLITLLIPSLTDPLSNVKSLVFIVGDPKQSIYGFRGADVGSFYHAEQLIEASNRQRSLQTGLLLLSESYRMAPRLLKEIDTACQNIFSAVSKFDFTDVPYDRLVPGRESNFNEDIGSIRLLSVNAGTTTSGEESASDDDSTANEDGGSTEDETSGEPEEDDDGGVVGKFDSIAYHINAILRGELPLRVEAASDEIQILRTVKPADIAVLVRKHVDARNIAQSLLKFGIPFRIYGGREFFSRPEVVDIRNLLLWLSDNHDSLSLTALLRSPILRLTDNELLIIALSSSKKTITLDAMEECINRDKASVGIKQAFQLLNMFRYYIQHQTPGDFIRKALAITRWHETIASDPRRDQILSNVDKLIGIIDETYSMIGSTLRDVVDSIKVPLKDDEGEGIVSLDTDCVQIMTIFQAKGLEFPIVFLVVPQTRWRAPVYYSSELVGPTFTLSKSKFIANPKIQRVRTKKAPSHIANHVHSHITKLAEASRVLYVGLTRARDHALICTDDDELITHLGSIERSDQISSPGSFRWRTNGDNVLDLTQYVADKLLIETASITQLLQAYNGDYGHHIVSGNSSTEIGTVFHDVIGALINNGIDSEHKAIGITLREIEQLIERIHSGINDEQRSVVVSMLDSVIQTELFRNRPTSCRAEVPLVSILDETVIQGRLDVFAIDNPTAHVWDWKTNAAENETDIERLVSHYQFQVQAYAWLCFSNTKIDHVEVTLMFVSAIKKLDKWYQHFTFDRSSIPAIESELRSALKRLTYLTTTNGTVEVNTPATILT